MGSTVAIGIRTRALALLARREHSRAELLGKLRLHAEAEDDLDALLDELEATGYLSDARVAEQLSARCRGRHGPRKLEHVLRVKGVTEDHIERAVASARADEVQEAVAVLRRRFGRRPENALERARQARYLSNRGFGSEATRKAFRALADDEAT